MCVCGLSPMIHLCLTTPSSPFCPLNSLDAPHFFSRSLSFHPISTPTLSLCSDAKCQWTRTYQKYPTQSEHLSSSHSLLYVSGYLMLHNSAPPFTAAPLPFSHLASFSCHSLDSSLHILPPPLRTLSLPLLPPYPIHHFTA